MHGNMRITGLGVLKKYVKPLFQLVAQLSDCPSCNTKQICGWLNIVKTENQEIKRLYETVRSDIQKLNSRLDQMQSALLAINQNIDYNQTVVEFKDVD
ncbi:hypothetical protein [Candidatus Endomicrobiellum trichonymphae]|uniref:hypothetical protein n=2 Tax=Endomicrobium trichonymphae TaxID=1408204 RepID=UPI000BAA813B|nr:hypothetical protein [Candidatus Endomicrobium trichonymphae]